MNPYFRYLWLIPILPLAGGLINGLFGKRFAKSMVATVALLFTGASFLIACTQAWALVNSGADAIEPLYSTWIRAGAFSVDFGLYLDHLSMIMMLVVTGVGFTSTSIPWLTWSMRAATTASSPTSTSSCSSC